MEKVIPLLNGMRIISNNINQVARKANETNNIYASDVEKLRAEVQNLSHILTEYIASVQQINDLSARVNILAYSEQFGSLQYLYF